MQSPSLHWHLSAAAGLLLTGHYRPVCSISWDMPRPIRSPFQRLMARCFDDADHCLRIHVEWIERTFLRR